MLALAALVLYLIGKIEWWALTKIVKFSAFMVVFELLFLMLMR